MTAGTLRHDLSMVIAALGDARAQAESGATIDLAGLDARVGTLCAAVQALPPAEGRALLAPVEALLDALDALAATLALQRDALAAAPHTARQRATAAYGRGAPDTGPIAGPVAGPVAVPPPPDLSSEEP